MRVVVILAVTLGWLGLASPASAHVELVSSTPASGARLDAVPAQVSLTFSGELAAPAYLVVTAPDGSALASGDATIEGATVTQAVTTSTASGAYLVAYRVNSVDGHQITGQINFSVGSSPAPSMTTPSSAAPSTEAPITSPAASQAATGKGWSLPGYRFWVGLGLFAGAGLLWVASRKQPRRPGG